MQKKIPSCNTVLNITECLELDKTNDFFYFSSHVLRLEHAVDDTSLVLNAHSDHNSLTSNTASCYLLSAKGAVNCINKFKLHHNFNSFLS